MGNIFIAIKAIFSINIFIFRGLHNSYKKLYLFYMYHFHNFGQSLKFRGGADSWESRGEGCSNRWKRPHRIQG